jgi:hypothetical protein
MAFLGVFRDDFYNAVSVLPQTQFNATTLATTSVLPASLIGGAGDCYINASGGSAVSYTTDSAVNIIAAIQNAVATAYKQGLGAFAAGVNPPPGVPNLFNMSWTLTINNQNTGTLTLVAGTGVTLAGVTTVATVTERLYTVTITSPTTVTIQGVYASLATL